MNKNNAEIKAMSVEQLHKHVEALRGELFGLRLNAATSHIKNYSQFKKLKRTIARALTYLRQKLQD